MTVLAFPVTQLPASGDGLFTAPQVIARTGITYRQLDYWTRTGRIGDTRPKQASGLWRGYTLRDIQLCGLVQQLLIGGLAFDAAFAAANTILDEGAFTLTLGDIAVRIEPLETL